jgi:hypothetical protein
MAEPDLRAGLQSLRESLRQMKALFAWKQLKESEAKPGQPPAFTLCDPTETDLRNEYSFFVSTAVQMHSILNEDSVPLCESARQSIKRQLARIEHQAYGLNLHQRFGAG